MRMRHISVTKESGVATVLIDMLDSFITDAPLVGFFVVPPVTWFAIV